MKNIIDIYEASLLDEIEDTIEFGNTIVNSKKLLSNVFSSKNKQEFNKHISKLISNIKLTYEQYDRDMLKTYFKNKQNDMSQIFVGLYNDLYNTDEYLKYKIMYSDARYGGEIRWEEANKRKPEGLRNTKETIGLKTRIDNYSNIFDFYIVPEELKDEWENIMKNRK